MAPITLAAAMSIVRRINPVSIVPSMPVKRRGMTLHIHLRLLAPDKTLRVKSRPVPTTAITKNAHTTVVGRVRIPEKVRKPAIIPITMLARTAMPVQLALHEQLFIKSPPVIRYAVGEGFVIEKIGDTCGAEQEVYRKKQLI